MDAPSQEENNELILQTEPSTGSDEQLAREAQTGSLDCFEQLVFRYERRVFAFISQFCPNAADASELTQDTFLKAFRKIGQYDSRRAFAPWLFTIARRNCIDRHRLAPPVADAPLPEMVDDATPSELIAQREEGENLWRLARERLGKTQFEALWLHYAEQMEVAQIAQVLGKTRVHVKVLLFRARKNLADELNRAHGSCRSYSEPAYAPSLPKLL
ncbi:MAG TPA: sigma-70 family RNA polymerase sigma factor [Verrucomicrobiae bacterium]|nr:sigma-70 family RNA polymerase sigma factor [Verrucomicrobiae bacterium]